MVVKKSELPLGEVVYPLSLATDE